MFLNLIDNVFENTRCEYFCAYQGVTINADESDINYAQDFVQLTSV